MSAGRREKNVYHEVKWTRDHVRRFWDFYAANRAADVNYFSRRFGSRIVRLAGRVAPLSGTVVDVGCGPGFLTAELLRRGHEVKAIDSSICSIERVRERFGGLSRFRGASVAELDDLPLARGEAGAVFMIEVLEHLPRGSWDRVVAEFARVVRPGGLLVVTTPNDEDLDASKIACPECGSVFHDMQHLESVDRRAMQRLLDRNGFEPTLVSGLNFRHYPDRPIGRLVRLFFESLPMLGVPPTPHLIAIGQRRPR